MKKLPLFLLLILAMSCGDEDLYVTPDGDDLQTVGIIEEVETPSSDIFAVVDESAAFTGGMKEYTKFLKENLNYPKQAKEMGVEGRVFISFVVDTDGSLSDFEIQRGIGAGCDEEALRVIMESPAWSPGKQGGVPVKTKMQLAVKFKLHDTDVAAIAVEEATIEEVVEEEVRVIQLDVETTKK